MSLESKCIARRFKIGKCIGNGSFGEIYIGNFALYLAYDMKLQNDVALKTVVLTLSYRNGLIKQSRASCYLRLRYMLYCRKVLESLSFIGMAQKAITI